MDISDRTGTLQLKTNLRFDPCPRGRILCALLEDDTRSVRRISQNRATHPSATAVLSRNWFLLTAALPNGTLTSERGCVWNAAATTVNLAQGFRELAICVREAYEAYQSEHAAFHVCRT